MEKYIGMVVATVVLLLIWRTFSWILSLRRVVPANEVDIVQTGKETISYGKDTNNGNTYYEWPVWLPLFGVNKTTMKVSVFDLDLEAYEAFDSGRLPFVVDIKAFFRVVDTGVAAQRVSSFEELKGQLQAIVQGAVRSILAKSDIEEIMQGRSKFGDEFTQEIRDQLLHWGVEAVKNVELMDLRDASGDSHVIRDIMQKKISEISMQSRTRVAENEKIAQLAELSAKQETETKQQEVEKNIGIRTAEKDQAVGIAKEKATQEVQEEAKMTMTKKMAVTEVERVAQANIEKSVQVVKAEETKQVAVIGAQGDKERVVLTAEASLESTKMQAEGIIAEGEAKAQAQTAILLAPVDAQIKLAQEIGTNLPYQQYLISLEGIKAFQTVGVEQAKALESAEIKVIANAGDVNTGINKVTDLLSAKGGLNIGAMMEAMSQTGAGANLLDGIVSKLKGGEKTVVTAPTATANQATTDAVNAVEAKAPEKAVRTKEVK